MPGETSNGERPEASTSRQNFVRSKTERRKQSVRGNPATRIFDDKIFDKKKMFTGETHIPKFILSGARRLIQRILDPNPKTRITIDEIKVDEWFKDGYTPDVADDEDEDVLVNKEAFSIKQAAEMANDDNVPSLTNAFQIIGMSSYLDLSGFFQKEDVSERKINFTSNYCSKELFKKIEKVITGMGFHVQKKNDKVRIWIN